MMITFSEIRKNRDLSTLEENILQAKAAIERNAQINLIKNGWKQFVITSDEIKANTAQNQSTSGQSDQTDGASNTSDNNATNDEKQKTKGKSKTKETKAKNSEPCIAVALNDKKIEKRRECAGFAAILFQPPPGSEEAMNADYVSSLYHHLVQIEERFRIMKSEFEIRPLFVRDRESVTGHVILWIAALIMVRLIQKKAAEKECSITAAKLKEIMNALTVLTLYRDDNHCVYLKSKEFNLTNGLRKVKEENSTSVVEPEFLFELLTGVKMPNVSTMEELRKIFKIKSMNRSKDQIEQLKCSVSA